MDQGLLAWGRRKPVGRLPRLWLFTDTRRLQDPRQAAARLPIGRAGIVLRHDGVPDRAALGRDLARICRRRRLLLVVAGDARLAARLRAGLHLRAGRFPSPLRPPGIVTSSAHSVIELRRAAAAGADLAFLSPAFPTSSHPGALGLGPLRWNLIARRLPAAASLRIGALGGVTGTAVRRLGARCVAIGAITALSG